MTIDGDRSLTQQRWSASEEQGSKEDDQRQTGRERPVAPTWHAPHLGEWGHEMELGVKRSSAVVRHRRPPPTYACPNGRLRPTGIDGAEGGSNGPSDGIARITVRQGTHRRHPRPIAQGTFLGFTDDRGFRIPRRRCGRCVMVRAMHPMSDIRHMVGYSVLELQGMHPAPQEQAQPGTDVAQSNHCRRRYAQHPMSCPTEGRAGPVHNIS